MRNYKETNGTLGSCDKHLYRAVTMSYDSVLDPILASEACIATCEYDDGPCSIAIWEGSTCFLGDWNVNANFYTTTMVTVLTRKRKG